MRIYIKKYSNGTKPIIDFSAWTKLWKVIANGS